MKALFVFAMTFICLSGYTQTIKEVHVKKEAMDKLESQPHFINVFVSGDTLEFNPDEIHYLKIKGVIWEVKVTVSLEIHEPIPLLPPGFFIGPGPIQAAPFLSHPSWGKTTLL